ncbi:hypothetical protein [Methylorubrum populi]|uniref:hypothetical protein n=1 Tax=Methylorubrum populi TaxID=223967 RepID=UPI00235558B5|nr:hypothetical protein [Methylorubrum populi]
MIHVYDGMAVLRRRFDEALPGQFGRGPRSVFTEMLSLPQADVALWCFEGKGAKFVRQKILPGYKDRPSTMTDGLHALVDLTRQALSHTRAFQISVPQREADDVIAHLCATYGETTQVTVHTVDRDLLALETKNVRVDVRPLKIVVDKEDPKKDRFVDPAFIRLYKALCGDPSDRVPGLAKFGPLTFAKCDWPRLNMAMKALVAGQVHRELFIAAGVKEPTADRICDPETVKHLKACWDVVGFLPMPSDWEDGITVGKPNPAAGDAILRRFMH